MAECRQDKNSGAVVVAERHLHTSTPVSFVPDSKKELFCTLLRIYSATRADARGPTEKELKSMLNEYAKQHIEAGKSFVLHSSLLLRVYSLLRLSSRSRRSRAANPTGFFIQKERHFLKKGDGENQESD
jgi:hypothetical protein